jgi:hypothetical protein
MSLTVRKKEHWKERIARRIDLAIEELQAAEDAGFYERLRRAADEQARGSLGLSALRLESQQIESELERLRERQRDLWAEMHSRVSGVLVKEISRPHSLHFDVQTALRRRRLVHERELLAASPLGQKILRLEREKDELLDTVWLATSPTQIKELWSRFSELLNWEPPTLQQQALAIEPMPTPSS